MSPSKTIAFFGASTGCGLAALKKALSQGHHCIALCRVPSKLTSLFPPEANARLQVVEGNAHDTNAVAQCLRAPDGRLVDNILFSIGGKPVMKGMKLTIDDMHVCEKGMDTLLATLRTLRQGGATGQPHITVVSTTGITEFGRDVPLLLVPLYHVALKVPHVDKKAMESALIASGETFTIVRPSLLVDGASTKPVRVGIEDPKTGRESEAIGYTISREATGQWIATNIIHENDPKLVNKIAMITV